MKIFGSNITPDQREITIIVQEKDTEIAEVTSQMAGKFKSKDQLIEALESLKVK